MSFSRCESATVSGAEMVSVMRGRCALVQTSASAVRYMDF
jgi:hypothetical protein